MSTRTATLNSHTAAAKSVARRRENWSNGRTYISAAVIVIWCLLPFYWMIVTAFRDVGYTFDSTPFFTHVTWDNFKTAFSAEMGNHLDKALLNSLLSLAITSLGVPAGASNPNHVTASKPL